MSKQALSPAMFSSATDECPTPQEFYDMLHTEFDFTLDPCATAENAKCLRYFTRQDDGLSQPWAPERVFCNPPYGREVGRWVRKAYKEAQRGALVVCLLAARTDTAWFHNYCRKADEIRFIRGRLRFRDTQNTAPFPSMVVVFRPFSNPEGPVCRLMDREQDPQRRRVI